MRCSFHEKPCEGCLEDIGADLAAALRESEDVIAQRDTALGLCAQRERELATVTADWKLERSVREDISGELRVERAAHAETRKALEAAKGASFAEFRNHAGTIGTLESTRADLANALENCGRYSSAHADVTIELRKAEARVKELEADNGRALKLCESLQRGFARG